MSSELLTSAERAVERAQAAGATHVWANADTGREVDFEMRQGNLENVKDSTSRSLNLRLYVDGRYSSVRTNDLREDRLGSFVTDAVALARALEPDTHRSLADPALYAGRHQADLELSDTAVDAVTRDQRVASLDANRSPGDRFRIIGQEIYLHLPNGAGRSKLTNVWFDIQLSTISTWRNWRTMNKLRGMLG